MVFLNGWLSRDPETDRDGLDEWLLPRKRGGERDQAAIARGGGEAGRTGRGAGNSRNSKNFCPPFRSEATGAVVVSDARKTNLDGDKTTGDSESA